MRIVHAHCVSGQGTGVGGVDHRADDPSHRPLVVIGVGIAMGFQAHQKIGDVMVSTEVRDTEMVRINADATY